MLLRAVQSDVWKAFGIPQHMSATKQAVAAVTVLCLAPFLAHRGSARACSVAVVLLWWPAEC